MSAPMWSLCVRIRRTHLSRAFTQSLSLWGTTDVLILICYVLLQGLPPYGAVLYGFHASIEVHCN
jgi:hypothetical protein